MNAYRCEKDVIQNLKDAGCDEATIRTFLDDLKSGKLAKGAKLLEGYRRSLLDDLHADQKRIDCLDYLLFVLQSKIGNKKTTSRLHNELKR